MLAHTGVVVNKPGAAAITQREREVLTLVAEHLTNAEIAADLCLSVRTVESHVSSMMRKTQVSDRRALARQARGVLDRGQLVATVGRRTRPASWDAVRSVLPWRRPWPSIGW